MKCPVDYAKAAPACASLPQIVKLNDGSPPIAVIRIRLKSPITESPEPGPRVATRGPQRVEDGRLDADETVAALKKDGPERPRGSVEAIAS